MSSLRRTASIVNESRSMALRQMSSSGIGDSQNNFSRHSFATDVMVSGYLAGSESEKWDKCVDSAASIGSGQLQDGVGAVTQVASCDGSSGSGKAIRSD